MARNYNYYAVVGDNGYGMSTDWSDIVQAAKHLRNEWHRGFQTEVEAYEYIKEQSMFRYALRSAGICDIDTLCTQKLVLLDDPATPLPGGRVARTVGQRCNSYRPAVKPRIVKNMSLAECLALDDEEDKPATGLAQQNNRDELFKAFEAWYTDHMQQKEK